MDAGQAEKVRGVKAIIRSWEAGSKISYICEECGEVREGVRHHADGSSVIDTGEFPLLIANNLYCPNCGGGVFFLYRDIVLIDAISYLSSSFKSDGRDTVFLVFSQKALVSGGE